MNGQWCIACHGRVPSGELIERLFRASGGERWTLSHDEFATVVQASVTHAFPDGEPPLAELERFLSRLHLADLALAAACALGRDSAWDHFVLEHRPALYRAADAIDSSGNARELADSLYADLYGIREDAGQRRSLFRYFHGRSSLATWLRAVLAQRHVDALRARKRFEPLPERDNALPAPAAPTSDPDRRALVPLVERALQGAIDRLPARDRLRLRGYYVSQLTLAGIGRITGEHEATVSRQLARTRRRVKDAVEQSLREQADLTRAQIERALELALEDPGGLDLQHVFDAGADRKKSARDRSE